MKKNFKDFSTEGNRYVPNFDAGNSIGKLPPGSYTLNFNHQTGLFWFEEKPIVSDSIIDLPSPEYTQIVNEMRFFMRPQVKDLFKRGGYIYKRSVLLHGLPGTGKTVIVNRVAADIIALGGICLWVTEPKLLEMAFEILNDIQPEILTGVIFEEFDGLVPRHESTLLTLLDGQVQKDNVIYLATTNYLNKIPARLYRPGRMSSVIEAHHPSAEARLVYLKHKYAQLGLDDADIPTLVSETTGLSVDQLKEVVQAVKILETPLSQVLARLRGVSAEVVEGGEEEGLNAWLGGRVALRLPKIKDVEFGDGEEL